MVVHRVVDAIIAFAILVPVAMLVAHGILGEAYNLRHSGITESFYTTTSLTLATRLHLNGIGTGLEDEATLASLINETVMDFIAMHGVTVPLPHLKVVACAYSVDLFLDQPCVEAGRGNVSLVKTVSATIGVNSRGEFILKVYRVHASG